MTERARDQVLGCMVGRLDVIEEMADDIFTGCIISEHDFTRTPEKDRWEMKYVKHRWTRQ